MAVSFCVHEDWTRACSRTVGNKVGPAQTESASGKTLVRSVASTQGQCALPEGLSRRESDKNCTPRPVPHPCVLCKGGIPRCSSPWALGLLRPYRMSGVPPTLSAVSFAKMCCTSRLALFSDRRDDPTKNQNPKGLRFVQPTLAKKIVQGWDTQRSTGLTSALRSKCLFTFAGLRRI
jgi:hypothetical protein